MHSPSRDLLVSESEAFPGTSSDLAEDEASLASAGLVSAVSERSSCENVALEELLWAVTNAVDPP